MVFPCFTSILSMSSTLMYVWCILKRFKFSPVPDVNGLMSVTNLNTLSNWCYCSKINNIMLSNTIYTLNTYLLCWFLICKTWNSISLFVNKYKCQQLILYTCICNMESQGYDQTLKICNFSETSLLIKFLFLIVIAWL